MTRFVRPEHLRVSPEHGDGLPAEILSVSFLGPLTRVEASVEGVEMFIDMASSDGTELRRGRIVGLSLAGPVMRVR